MKSAVVLAVIFGVVLAAGIGWIYPPAGVIALGVEGLFAAYARAYLKARGSKP